MKAKTKFAKLWSILLALAMVVGMLPTTVLATGSESADFVSDPITALALLNDAKTGEADSTWDSDTKTLTLNGMNFETTAATAVRLPDGANIILNGENIITSNPGEGDCHGIYAYGNLTIQGTGTLNVTGGEATNGDSYGIYASGHDEDYIGVKISGGATVNATGGEAGVESYGINAYCKVNIAGGTVTANGGTATNNSYGIYADDDVNISGGTVNANGGTATNNSYGIYAHYDVNISGGTLIAKVTSGNGTANALNRAPKTLPDTYWWRTSNSGAYHKYPASAYIWDAAHTYFEIQKPGYTVTFDANGGSGEMTGADVVSGEYTLPANGFTAPEGKRFKAWSVNGTEKAVGDKITVSADTTVKAVWEAVKYNVTVTNGTASVSKAAVGTTVTLNANAAPDGQVFDKWVVESGGITLADENSATTTFTMPAGDVSVKATYHTHSYGSVWKSDADKHWHECSCGDKSAEAVHTAGDWIIDTPATATTAGTKHKECTTCSYVMENGTIPATGYTVSFDANGGTGTMADVTGVLGDYTLPANDFTAPEGKQFKAWSVGGNEKDAGDKIAVAADTTVKAVWENIPAGHTCDIKPVAKVNPSCTEGGKEAYYKCEGCGKFFEDALGAKEITDLAAWGNIPKNGHTESDWKSDKDNHWKECTVAACGVIIENSKAAHKDDNNDGKCDTCEYNVGTTITNPDNKPSDDVQSPQTGDNSIMWLWVALLFVSGFGVVATAVYGKKKKSVK